MKRGYAAKTFEIFLIASVFLVPLVFYGGAANPFWVVERFVLTFSVSLLAAFYLLSVIMKEAVLLRGGAAALPAAVFLLWGFLAIIKVDNLYMFSEKMFSNISVFLFYFMAYSYFMHRPKKRHIIVNFAVFSAFLMALYGILQSAGMDFVSWTTDFGPGRFNAGQSEFSGRASTFVYSACVCRLTVGKRCFCEGYVGRGFFYDVIGSCFYSDKRGLSGFYFFGGSVCRNAAKKYAGYLKGE